MIVGLTGGIGSGKTTVLTIFRNFENIAVYIADKEAKELMTYSSVIKTKLIAAFGDQVYLDHKLNKDYLSTLVFKDKKKLQQLNAIVHPEVKKHFQDFVKTHQEKAYILYENAILFETKNHLFCDYIITVFADLEERIKRIIIRDTTTKEAVLDRMKNQFSEDKKALQSNYLIDNTFRGDLSPEIRTIHNFLTKRA